MTELHLNIECPTCRAMTQLLHGVYRCPWARDDAAILEAGVAIQPCSWPLRDPSIRERPKPPTTRLDGIER